MRTKTLSGKLLRFVLLLMLLALSLGAWQWRQQRILYPTSDIFINPTTGKPDPAWEANLLPSVFVIGKEEFVFIELGDVQWDTSTKTPLMNLSPIIRMHPKVQAFWVTWNVPYARDNFGYELKYNRRTGEVTETRTFLDPDSTSSTIIAQNVTDKDIHEGAKVNSDYPTWALKY